MAHTARAAIGGISLSAVILAPAGIASAVAALVLCSSGGMQNAVFAGLLAALALQAVLGLTPHARSSFSPSIFVFDALAAAGYTMLCDPSGVLWRAPSGWGQLFSFSPAGAGFATGLYIAVIAFITLYSGRRPSYPATFATFAIPFIFCIFMALSSDLPLDAGRLVTFGLSVPHFGAGVSSAVRAAIGESICLVIINEAIIAGAAIALGRSWPRDARLHASLVLAAIFAALTPLAASLGSSERIAFLAKDWPALAPVAPFLQVLAMSLAAAVAQAGIWGETYLVTEAITDLLHGVPPIAAGVRSPWISGMKKGAVYGFVFIALVTGAGALVAWPPFAHLFALSGEFAAIGAACIAGAILFPLARTVLESTDSTPPFAGRLKIEFEKPSNYLRGLVVGAAVIIALIANEPDWPSFDRFVFGVIAGAGAALGVDLASDIVPVLTGRRKHLSSLRVYIFSAVVGGVVGGAIGWYLDAGQLGVVHDKFVAYNAINYQAAGRAVQPDVINPLFSKWGSTNLGPVDGGVKLFYLESVSGVLQWIFAAPLFSINLFFLTALVKRDLKPLRTLVSEDGVRLLVDNAIMVLRWGLWMAPVIYTFLKVAPVAHWYNQDGAVRSGVATMMALTLPPQTFAQWSLDVFTALLAYDWLRVLIWFDHMGLRVATLVNLSFVGGDVLDEKSARFLGKAQKSRAIPDGVRRFGTWAPLLIPFYIPRGEQWDHAWNTAEQMRTSTPPLAGVLMGYAATAGAGALVLGAILLRRLARGRPVALGTGVAGFAGASPFVLTNGLLTTEWYDDGQGVSRVESAARGKMPIDLTRGPDDPFQPRGKFLYIREDDGELWSLGSSPVVSAGAETSLQRLTPSQLFLTHTRNGLRIEATIEVVDGEAVEITRVKLVNLERRPRRVSLASFREWVVNETGVERRDPAYNAIHVGTWFLRDPGAIVAQNRLLKGGRHLSQEVAFHAAGQGPTGEVLLTGYEDVKSRFFGMSTVANPDQLAPGSKSRNPGDEGLLYGFEPCACLRFDAKIAPESTTEIILVDGWAKDMQAAVAAIARHLDRPLPDEAALEETASRQRSLLPAANNGALRFEFAGDGRSLQVAPCTPRPYAHVLANAFGQGSVLTNDGDIFSFYGNARQNSITPFRMAEGRAGPVGQAIYVSDMAGGEADCATFLPLRRKDGVYSATFTPGTAVYNGRRGDLELELTVFVPPGRSVELKLLRLKNHGSESRLYNVSPIAEIVLAETAADSRGMIESERDPSGRALYFHNPTNDFVKGWAFVSTSLATEFAETSRRRCLGEHTRASAVPYLATHAHPDAGDHDPDHPVAAFCGTIEVRPGAEALVCVAIGQAGALEEAKHFADVSSDVEWAQRMLAETRRYWDEMLGRLRIETNRPDFDRLVNDWLPYQLLVARLWGRTGPTQRSGATGYRDQLQDVLPLVFIAPDLARRQILLHAARQFIEGDAVKWWHTAPGGGTGLADRTHAADPQLWLPYVAIRYVDATGDEAVLDVDLPFIEAEATPRNQEGRASVPLPSRESAALIDHCWRAIQWSLDRFGKHGLPLMGTGDWDDGMNLVGAEGRGESVWLGFFLHGILIDFARLLDKRGRRAPAQTCRDRAEKLRAALDECWRGDRYLRAYADDGREIAPMSTMTAAWPALSGAVTHDRGVEAVDKALELLARPDRILLVTPPYDEHSDPYPGRSAEYPPGVRENGGQYSHGSSWFVDALSKLANEARDNDNADLAAKLSARAFLTWRAISPLSKFTTPEAEDIYGLPPHQQAADVYEGPGYEGRGGWSWYTGSAARMMSAAYAMLGLRLDKGEFTLRPDSFEPKGELVLKSVTYRGRKYSAPAKP